MRLGLSLWEPYKGLDLFSDSFHRIFDETANTLSGFGIEDIAAGSWAPRVNIYETEHSYVLSADLPGMKKEDIGIDLKDHTLTISGERKFEEKHDKDNYARVERKYGKFVRSFSLSDHVDTMKIRASYKDGVLEIKIPKREESATKEIKVDVS